MLKLSRRLDADFRVLRYDRRGYGRSFPHAGPFTMDAQVSDLVGLLAGRTGGAGRPQLWREHRPRRRRSASRSGCRRCRLRDAAVVGAVVAGHHRRSDRRRRGGQASGSRRAVHAADARRSALGGATRADQGRLVATRASAMVEELADLRRNRPWDRRTHHGSGRHRVRQSRRGPSSTRDETCGGELGCPRRRTCRLPARRAAEPSGPVQDRSGRPAAAEGRPPWPWSRTGYRDRDVDVGTEERTGDIVWCRQTAVPDLAGAVLQGRPLRPHAERQAGR